MSFWSDLTGDTAADASKAAAADQYGKQTTAAGDLRNAGNTYQSALSSLSQSYNPYVQGGGKAQNQVYDLLGLNGQPQQSTAFGQFQSDPGYQFQMGQGLNAVDHGAAARSGVQNGATIKAEQRFGTGLADQSYNSYLQRLMGLGQQGLGATQAQNTLQAQGYGGQLQANTGAANQMFGAAGTIGQGDIAAANAKAQGSQHLLDAGMKIGGMVLSGMTGMPIGGGGSSFFGGGSGGSFGNSTSSYGTPGYYGGSPSNNPNLSPFGS